MRGGLHAGALSELAKHAGEPHIYKLFPGGVYGISVGAIVGTYVAFGLSADDISDIMQGWSGVPLSPPTLETISNFSKTKGLDDGAIIRERMRHDFSKKGMRFDDLRIGDALIPLHIVGADYINARAVLFGKGVTLWDAIRSSTSLPLVFAPHTFSCGTFIDGSMACTNVIEVIPPADRSNVVFLLITRTLPFKLSSFMETFHSLKAAAACRSVKRRYPNRTCLLIDDETPVMDVWSPNDVAEAASRVVVGRGAECFRKFILETPEGPFSRGQ